MTDLIERKPLYERAVRLETEALDYASKLIEKGRVGEVTSEDWRIWSAVLAERTAFKHDVFDAPSAESHTIYCKDCKFSSYEPDGKSADVYVCNYSRWRRSEGGLFPDDFCSRAEEREDG